MKRIFEFLNSILAFIAIGVVYLTAAGVVTLVILTFISSIYVPVRMQYTGKLVEDKIVKVEVTKSVLILQHRNGPLPTKVYTNKIITKNLGEYWINGKDIGNCKVGTRLLVWESNVLKEKIVIPKYNSNLITMMYFRESLSPDFTNKFVLLVQLIVIVFFVWLLLIYKVKGFTYALEKVKKEMREKVFLSGNRSLAIALSIAELSSVLAFELFIIIFVVILFNAAFSVEHIHKYLSSFIVLITMFLALFGSTLFLAIRNFLDREKALPMLIKNLFISGLTIVLIVKLLMFLIQKNFRDFDDLDDLLLDLLGAFL